MYVRISESEDERLCDCPLDNFKCNTGGCISNRYVCDGQPNCPDLSDEWDCYHIDKMDNDDIQTALRLRTSKTNGELKYVCDDNWTNELATEVCQKMGYARSIFWSQINVEFANTNTTFLRLAANASTENGGLLLNLNVTDRCQYGIVGLECEQYGKLSTTNIFLIDRHSCDKLVYIACGSSKSPEISLDEDNKTWTGLALANSSSHQCIATIGKSAQLFYVNSIYHLLPPIIVSPRWALASHSCIIDKSRPKQTNWSLDLGTDSSIITHNPQIIPIARVWTYPQVFLEIFRSHSALGYNFLIFRQNSNTFYTLAMLFY